MLTLLEIDDDIPPEQLLPASPPRTRARQRMERAKSLSLPEREQFMSMPEETLPVTLRPRPKDPQRGFSRTRLCSVCWREESERILRLTESKYSNHTSDTTIEDFDMDSPSDSKRNQNLPTTNRYNLRSSSRKCMQHSDSEQSLQEDCNRTDCPNLVHGEPGEIPCFLRYNQRRGALCDPNKMLMSQNTRESILNEASERRKSFKRKVSNFFTVKLNLDKEEDLF